MPNIVILTGRNLKPTESFYPFLIQDINSHLPNVFNIQVIAVDDFNRAKSWLDTIAKYHQNYPFDTQSYIIAHSMGALAMCKFLTENELEIRALHLIAPVFDQNIHPNQGAGGGQLALDFNPNHIDYLKLTRLAWQIHLHHSLDDDRVDYSNSLRYKQIIKKAVLHTYNNRLHFRENQPFVELSQLIYEQYQQSLIKINGQEAKIKLLPIDKLPLKLPVIEDYAPTSDGSSPLKKTDWYKFQSDGQEIYHEADTMPNWAGSSWYFLRFCDPHNPEEFASLKNLEYWLPVDHYFGGSEHTTVHLLYSRFWHQFLYNINYLPSDIKYAEPYKKRTNGGIMLGRDGQKMSKSKGNGVNPKDKLEEVGADALRLYICFIGPYEATVIWQDGGLKACKKLVDNINQLAKKVDYTDNIDIHNIPKEIDLESIKNSDLVFTYHVFIKNLTQNITEHKLNVAVAEIMSFTNTLKTLNLIPLLIWKNYLLALAPFAPFITEELWSKLQPEVSTDSYQSIHLQAYPKFNPKLCQKNTYTIAVQINGKLRTTFEVDVNTTETEIIQQAQLISKKWLDGKVEKFVKYVPNKLVSFVVE